MKLAFQIIFIVFAIMIYLIFFSTPPRDYVGKLYLKIDNNKPCFYVDNMSFFSAFKSYKVSNFSVYEKNITKDVQIMWDLEINSSLPIKQEENFLISSFYGVENCISYGDNKNIKGIRNAKPLNENIEYVANILSNSPNASASFSTVFKLHKNQSTGKMEVEIVDN